MSLTSKLFCTGTDVFLLSYCTMELSWVLCTQLHFNWMSQKASGKHEHVSSEKSSEKVVKCWKQWREQGGRLHSDSSLVGIAISNQVNLGTHVFYLSPPWRNDHMIWYTVFPASMFFILFFPNSFYNSISKYWKLLFEVLQEAIKKILFLKIFS